MVPANQRRELQQVAQLGAFTALWSPWIIAELNRVLTWQWIARRAAGSPAVALSTASLRACSHAAQQMMQLLIVTMELVDPRPPYPIPWPTLHDPGDHPIWATAKLGQAQYVISENTRHFPPAGADGHHVYEAIEYLRGQDFLRLLEQR